jgi:cation:H+ antiporter
MIVWLKFFFLTSIITFFGFKLSVLADEISDKTKLGRNLIGLILLSTVTSLPELVIGISSVKMAKNPNLAIGDVLGSCCFNLATVVLLDVFYRRGSVYSRSTQSHIYMCLMGVILIGTIGMSLALKDVSWMSLGNYSTVSFFIPIVYFLMMSSIYRFEKSSDPGNEVKGTGIGKTLIKFAGCSLAIVISGIFLPHTAEQIIELMGWNAAFMGTFFVALATSLPEISVTLSALRINAAELAFSNLLGSNIFNVLILSIDDFFYAEGPLLAAASDTHIVTTFTGVMMTGLVAIALMKPPQKKVFNIVSSLSYLIVLTYALNLVVSYLGSN